MRVLLKSQMVDAYDEAIVVQCRCAGAAPFGIAKVRKIRLEIYGAHRGRGSGDTFAVERNLLRKGGGMVNDGYGLIVKRLVSKY
ncbi:hypothetical protein GCM10007857_70940 [Bradyrhizobium iriomotense]|uniref:Uncharacterized protein n=1 Tax=Bradyrhizobium iriomotense TaxID=441950 RepID=A0ABQ6BAC1_9BRAD|nr:hypothetical protein GCM10007857_70940 [Bradyrhizobium iriomotense]